MSPRVPVAPRFLALSALFLLIAAAGPAAAQNRLSISTSVLDAPGGTVPSGQDFRYRVSYSCDLVSIPTCDGAQVMVDLPPELEFQGAFFPPLDVASAMHDGSPTGGVVTFTFQPSVPAGNTGDLDITVRFPNGSTPDGTTTTNLGDAAVSTGTGLVTQMVDLPPVTATASPQVDLDVALQGRWIDDCPDPNVYEVTIGPSAASGSLNFIDVTQLVLTLPTGVTGVVPNDGGVYDMPSNTVTWTGLGGVSVPSSITVSVGVSFPDPPFMAGQTVTAFAEATIDALGEPPGTTVGPLPFDHTLQQFVETPSASVDKRFSDGRPDGLPPAEGQQFTYRIDMRNDGNIALDSLVVVDDGDGAGADLDGALTIDAVSTGAYDAGYTGVVTIRYTTNLAGPTLLGSSPGNTDANFPIPALGVGERVVAIEWDFAGPIPVGTSPTTHAEVTATVDVGFPAGTTVDNHLTADWTATLTGLCGGSPGPASGSTADDFDFDVADPYTYLRPRKNEVTSGPYFPGDTISFSFEITNRDLANDPATDPVVTDLLPNFLTFQGGSETYADNGTGVVLAAPADFEVLPNYNGTGRTLLRWNLTGDLDPGETVDIGFDVTVETGVIFGTLTNRLGMTFPGGGVQQVCSGSSAVDVADLDGDTDTTDLLCVEDENVTIAAVAQLASTKFVRGQCDGGFIPGLGTGTSLPGGAVDWRVSVQNIQTVPMEDFVIVDILPFVGDTGVRDLTPRLSLFRPLLVAPISPPPGGAVFYSLSGNPCRPEVGGPTSGCDAPNWTPIPPDPITDVQSVKIEFGDRVVNPLDTLEFGWPMVLPADAPTDGSEAFNSFAFGARRQDDGGFLGAEPNKVGIDATCTPSMPNDNMLGDFVWRDDDGDGIQDPGETGINDVRAELYSPGPDGMARTGDDVLLLTTITADDGLGNPGWYKFNALSPGDYYVLFHPPLGFDVSPQNVGGDGTVDSDTDPASACTDLVTLGPPMSDPDVDMGLVPRTTASLGDYVWFDLNGDGVQNEALERGLNGTTVRLFADDGDGTPEPFGDDGAPLRVTVTADDVFGNPGFYLFEELVPGVPYFVQFVEPSPSTGFTTRNAGGDDAVDSDARGSNGTSHVVTLAAGEHDPTIDAGIELLTGTLALGNVVWIDEDGNGVFDAAGDDDGMYDPLVPEPGVNGVRVNLYLDIGGDGLPQVDEFVATTQTQTLAGQAGRYRFTGLPAGEFIVEVDPSNFGAGGPLQGFISTSFDTVDANDDVDSDDSGRPLGTSVVSPAITLSSNGEPTADADDDLEDDDDWNFTLDFGFVPGPSPVFDYGDNPDAGSGTAQGDYRTVNFDGGPSHLLTGPAGPYLGDCVDADDGQNQNVASTADDLAGAAGPTFGVCATAGDDEDGVAFSSTLLAIGGTVDVTLSSSSGATCTINGFIDWNRNGDYGDPGEHVLSDVGAGLFPAIPVPATAVPGFTYARFRCSSAGGDGPDGPSADGEVEDYRLRIIGADWGDAPDSYMTTMGAGGPVHSTNPDVEMYLGNCVDTESNGQPTFGADGDDLDLGDSRIGDCVDDEDGVVFGGMLVRGMSTNLTITASMPGRLDGWIDWDADGSFDPGDQVIVNQAVVAGANPFVVAVPALADPGLTYARFRYSTAGGLPPGGPAADGEVEDHQVLIKAFDYGDAPDPVYPTLLASNGARHVVDPTGTVYLGPNVVGCADVENDGAPSAGADGDDLAATIDTGGDAGICDTADDEDGVVFDTMLVTCQQAQITITAQAAGRLDAWIDFDPVNGNAFGGVSDQIFASTLLAVGPNVLTFDVPCTAQLGPTYARFRFSTAGSLAPDGTAMDGEVEDYAVFVKGVDFGDAADSHGTSFGSGGPNHGVDPNDPTPLILGACVDTETDASTPLDTTGDDASAGTSTVGTCAVANDDEDGVTFTTMLVACDDASIDVAAPNGGVLDAWIDWNGDGDFGEANERIANGQALVSGVNDLDVSVPCAVAPGNVSARFRLSSAGVAGPTGPSMDGEVEDYQVFLKGADFGDAPDSYGTTDGSNGPSHGVDPTASDFFLGSCVDTEGDAQAPLDSTGDDANTGTGTDGTCTGNDDEDGVVFDTMLIACQDADLTVTATAVGFLDAWIDWDGDGTFAQAGDRVFSLEVLAAGANALTVSVPCTAAAGTSYARFRFSSTGALSFDGPTMDGEVEDHPVLLKGSDLGDAPDSYATLEASGGPVHGVDPAGTLFLGTCVDTESDAQAPLDATGDDVTASGNTVGTCTGNDDEDGVAFDTMLVACQDADLTVTAGSAGVLDGWIDFGADGSFAEAGDRVFTGQAVAAGANSLTITVPCDAAQSTTYARFRLSSTGTATSGGPVMDGEVEDYEVLLKGTDFGDAPDSYDTTFATDGPRHGVDPGAGFFLGSCVDVEADAEAPLDATGDDATVGLSTVGTCAGNDDEDGVVFDTMLIACQDVDLTVTASLAGVLDAWVDFAGDGAFTQAGDRVFTGQALAAGPNSLTFAVPCDATVGTTYARFRLSSGGVAVHDGPAMDGEVEDYEVRLKGSDFGDAPDSYATTAGIGGAVHGVDVDAPYHLGACVDTETDAGTPLDATGDDTAVGTSTAGTCDVAADDEDGVTFDTMLAACRDADLTVTATAAGLLDAWIDFGADGVFDAGDRIFTGQALGAGANALTFNVPCTAAPGGTYARFRFSTTGVAGPDGPAMDGEVEDYAVELKGADFGDDPDSYATSFGAGGPFHTVDPALGLHLGACVDTESTGPPSGSADGDDLAAGSSVVGTCTGADDEDGVVFDSLVTACKSGQVTVTASAAALLDAWIDFDADGSFDAGDQIFTSEPLVAGPNPLAFAVPCTAADGTTYARFRLSSAGGLGPDGPADDGEVEDYVLTSDEVDFGDAPDTYGTLFASGGPLHGLDPIADLYLGACVDSETEGQPSVGADGDDVGVGATTLGTCAGSDDEDGVVFDTLLIACQTADLTVTASNAGRLDAWIDFGGDGTFAGPADQIFVNEALVAGANALQVAVPCDAAPGDTYARFRFSSVGGLSSGGTTPNGEIEDYRIGVLGSDLGDAPDTYQTSFAVGGPNHGVDGSALLLGTCVDTDADGQPSGGADGDDANVGTGTVGICTGDDDEDGVVFDTMVNVCLDATITVTAMSAGVLDAWLDLDGDGTFNGPADRLFTAEPLVAGPNSLVFTVPCDATPGDSYARFRFSSTGVPTFAGPATDGEVEDYAVLVKGFDFGDAPDPDYPTLLASDGARHIVLTTGNPTLGDEVDIEPEALQSDDHQGDDEDGLDDEDGVVFLDDDDLLIPGTTTQIEVTGGSVGGLLDAFVDWNGDGDWEDAGEQIAVSVPVAADTTVTLDVDVPVDAVAGPTCARFRLSTAGGLTSTGQAPDGEVEDYGVEIGVADPILGLGKQVLLVEQLGFNQWMVRFEMVVENLGNVPISEVQIEADLATAFAAAEGFFVDQLSSDDLTVNAGFDGMLDIFVLDGTETLDVGDVASVILDLVVMPGTQVGPYVCSGLVTGVTPEDDVIEDVSQDGGDPDADDDGDASDDDDPTVVIFDIPVVEIPTLGPLGLALLALLLGLATVRRLRG